jgi:hypothetical protein
MTEQPSSEELEKIEKLLKDPGISKGTSLVLAAWKLYWLAREYTIAISKGKLDDKNFGVMSQALSKAACSGFKIGKFKNQVKNEVLPFLKRLAAQEAKTEDKDGHVPGQQPGGDE